MNFKSAHIFLMHLGGASDQSIRNISLGKDTTGVSYQTRREVLLQLEISEIAAAEFLEMCQEICFFFGELSLQFLQGVTTDDNTVLITQQNSQLMAVLEQPLLILPNLCYVNLLDVLGAHV